MDDRLERARRALRAADADCDRSVRWFAWSLALVVLSYSNLIAQRLHWLPIWVTVPLAGVLLAVCLVVLVPVVRWMWVNRPRHRL